MFQYSFEEFLEADGADTIPARDIVSVILRIK